MSSGSRLSAAIALLPQLFQRPLPVLDSFELRGGLSIALARIGGFFHSRCQQHVFFVSVSGLKEALTSGRLSSNEAR